MMLIRNPAAGLLSEGERRGKQKEENRMTKKIVALLMALVLVFAMTACAKTETPAPSADAPATDAPAAETPADEPAEPAEPAEDLGDIVTLKYYEIGNQDTNTRPAVQDAINAHIEPLIGANVEFMIIGWGDWDNKALTALQSGEPIDIFFTADWKSYVRSVTMNLFTPLNDDEGENGNLLEQYGQDILTSLNPAFITGTQYNGINYAVPTNKELCVPTGYIYNVTAAEEVGMDPATITAIADFEPYLAKFKELHPDQYPYLADGSWGSDPFYGFTNTNGISQWAAMYHEPKDGVWDESIFNAYDTPEYKAQFELMYKWNQAGYIHPDSSLTTFDVASSPEFAAGQWLFISAPLKGENIKGQELVIASGNMDLKVNEIYGQGKYCITTHAGGSMLAIPIASENPVKAMKYINLMHSDTELLDMMLFGVPEEMWKFADDGRVEVIDSSWYSAHGGAWTLGDVSLQHVTTLEDPEKNQKLIDYSADAIPHPSLGFRYVVPAELEPQVAALVNVNNAMERALKTGAVDPAVELPKFLADGKAAGSEAILADVQAQYEAWKAAKGE